MTAKELRARDGMIAMCQSDNFRVLLAFFMENCPHVGVQATDPTSLIRNEGKMQGYYGLLNQMRGIHREEPKPEEGTTTRRPLYEDPDELRRQANRATNQK